MRLRILPTVLLSALTLAASVSRGHHSVGGEFDNSREVTVAGKVTEVHLINPHAYFLVEVMESGHPQTWTLTWGPAIKLIRGSGWTRDTLKPGDTVTATGRPMRKGNGMYISHLVNQDGTVLIGELVE